MGFEEDFGDMLDHEVAVGRPTFDETDDTASLPPRTVTEVATGVPMAIQMADGEIAQREFGVIEQATHQAFTGPERDIEGGDILRVEAGPHSGRYFVVGAPPYKPQSHHLELVLELSEEEERRASLEPWT